MKTTHMRGTGPVDRRTTPRGDRDRLARIAVVVFIVGAIAGGGVAALAYQQVMDARAAATAAIRTDLEASAADLTDRIGVLERGGRRCDRRA